MNDLDLPSRWIIARFYETADKVAHAIENFRYSEGETLIQDFFWGDYCDWYLELIKAKFSDPNVQKTALFVLKNSLKMMHPFIPFVTEEIYSKINSTDLCLSVAQWPQRNDALIDAKASTQMQTIIDVISSTRNIRTQWNIKPNEMLNALIVPVDLATEELFKNNSDDIKRLARLNTLTIDMKAEGLKDAATSLVGQIKVFIPLGGLVDLGAETKRMSADMAQKQKAIDGLLGRLNNEAFVSKAPEDIILKEKERLETLKKEVFELQKILANIG